MEELCSITGRIFEVGRSTASGTIATDRGGGGEDEITPGLCRVLEEKVLAGEKAQNGNWPAAGAVLAWEFGSNKLKLIG
jgi:hypothetical protein